MKRSCTESDPVHPIAIGEEYIGNGVCPCRVAANQICQIRFRLNGRPVTGSSIRSWATGARLVVDGVRFLRFLPWLIQAAGATDQSDSHSASSSARFRLIERRTSLLPPPLDYLISAAPCCRFLSLYAIFGRAAIKYRRRDPPRLQTAAGCTGYLLGRGPGHSASSGEVVAF